MYVALYNTSTFHSPHYLQVRPVGYTSEKLHKQLWTLAWENVYFEHVETIHIKSV